MSCIYGPHQFGTEDQGWVAHFLIRAHRRASRSRSTATACRCATSCSSTTWSTRFLAAAQDAPQLAGKAFNIGGGPGNVISLLDLLDRIEACSGRRPDGRTSRTGAPATSATTSPTPRASAGDRLEADGVGGEGIERLYRWLREQRGVRGRRAPGCRGRCAASAAACRRVSTDVAS